MERKLIVKENMLIEASHRLNEAEQRLILLAILKARETDKTWFDAVARELTIDAEDYIRIFGVERQTAYKVLKETVISLFRKEYSYKCLTEKGNVEVRHEVFIQSAAYIENEAKVRLMFGFGLVPMLIELEKNFTQYEISQVANLSSRYAMRLYEFLIQYRSTGVFNTSLEDFRYRLGLLDHEYKSMSDFKKYVLDMAIKQINKHTDITVTYEQSKKGRKIDGFTFKFKQKAKEIKSSDGFIKMSDNQRLSFANKLAKLPELSHLATGSAGQSYEIFAQKIAEELLDKEKQKKYISSLEKLGFKQNK